jgi:hypothetical protein
MISPDLRTPVSAGDVGQQTHPSMPVRDLDPPDQALLRRCLEFILTTPQLDGEFETRLGVTPHDVHQLLAGWPRAEDDGDEAVPTVAISNALNEITHGLRVSADDERRIGSSRDAVQALYSRWARSRGWTVSGLR